MATTEAAAEAQVKPNSSTPSARNRAAVLAQMDKLEPEKPKEAAAETAEETADVEPDKEETTDAGTTQEQPDPDTDKGLDRIKAAEKRMRMDLQREKDDWNRERESHKEEIASAKRIKSDFEQLRSRAKYDPVSILKWLGVGDEDLEDVSKLVYASSPAFAKDPKNKDAASRMAREREHQDKVRALEERQAKLEAELKAKEEAASVEKQVGEFLDGVVKAVTDEAPLVHKLVERSPKQARADLRQIAEVMVQEDPHAALSEAAVVSMLEQVMLMELEESGADVSQFKKSKSKPEEKKKDEKKQELAKPAKGRVGRADIVAAISRDDLKLH